MAPEQHPRDPPSLFRIWIVGCVLAKRNGVAFENAQSKVGYQLVQRDVSILATGTAISVHLSCMSALCDVFSTFLQMKQGRVAMQKEY